MPLQKPKTVPPEEEWFWENDQVVAMVERGLEQSANGETSCLNLDGLADLDDDLDMENLEKSTKSTV